MGPIILEDVHGSVAGTDRLAVSPDGNIIYTASGQALRTGSFNQVGKVGAGVARVSDDGSLVYVAQAPDTISVYETTTYALVGSVTTPCSMDSIHAFDILPNGTEYVIQADDIVCAGPLDVIEPPADGIFATDSLGGLGADMEVDSARQRLYVFVPSRNQVVVISTETFEIIERVTVGTGPRGIDISVDGSLLFVALDGGGSVVFLDLETFNFSKVEIGTELGNPHTWDVIEGRSGLVFASASNGSSSYIVMIDRDANNAAIRVANGRFIRDRPIFAGSPDRTALYVGSGYTSSSLYKLGITDNPFSGPTVGPIILESNINSVRGTHQLAVSPDGKIIYTASGQALRTGSFIQVGTVGAGVPRISDDGALVYVAQAPDTISVYGTATYTLVGSMTTPCSMVSIHAFDILPNGEDYVIQADDIVCAGTLDVIEPPVQDIVHTDRAALLLGDLGVDMEVDAARQRLYVSVPGRNQVVVISTETYEIIERVTFGARPRGIDISIDGRLLFVALDGSGSVGFLDLETFNFSEVEIGAELGSPRTWDVIEGRPGRVFVSANPSFHTVFSYIVMIDRDANNAAIRVAGGRIIQYRPVFARSPDRRAVYVGEGSSPRSLYKLGISDDPVSGPTVGPIILEDGHSSVSGTHELAVSPDGNIIYTAIGQALTTGSFVQVGTVGWGVPRISDDGSLVYIAQAPDTISVYETATYTLVASMTTPCSMVSIHAFDILPNGEDYVILADDFVCMGTLDEIELPADDIFPKDSLGGLGADMEVDAARQRLYVSVPSLNQVVVISTETYEIIERVTVGTGPRGIDMSIDGSLLFVALDGGSSVVFLDLETFNFSQVEIGKELGSPRTWDVIEGRHGRVFASANRSFGGLPYIVMIDRDANNAAIRVAGGRIIQYRPVFARSPDRRAVYVGEGSSPRSLYKLGISDDPVSGPTVGPIILEDGHSSVSGTHELAVSPDGNIIYTAIGQALTTGSFVQVGTVGAGVPRVSDDGSLVYVAQAPETISVYETTTYTLVDSITTPCSMDSIQAFDILPNGEDYVIQADDFVCTGNLSGQRLATESFSIPDRGGQSITSSGTEAETQVGYGRIAAGPGSTTPSGIAIIGYSRGGTLISEAGVPATEGVRQGRIFAEVNDSVNTGLAIANPNDAPATVAFYFTDTEGVRFGEGSFELGAHEQTAKFLDETPFNGGDEVSGTFTFTSSLPIAVIALRGLTNRDGEFLMTTLPAAPWPHARRRSPRTRHRRIRSTSLISPMAGDGRLRSFW